METRWDHDWRGDAKSERTFSAPSLYFLSFFTFTFSGSSASWGGGPLMASDAPAPAESPVGDCSEEPLAVPTDTADSFDFNDGLVGSALFTDGDGVSKPGLEVVDTESV